MKKSWRSWFGGAGDSQQIVLPETLDLLSPAFVQDPYPTYAALRKDRPVASLASGGILLTRHADITEALGHQDLGNAPSRFSVLAARNRQKHVAADVAAHIPPFLDGDEHLLARREVGRAAVKVLRAQTASIGTLAEEMVGDVRPGRFDLVSDLSRPFACLTASRFVGCAEDTAVVKRLTSAFFHLFAPISDAATLDRTNQGLAEARQTLSTTDAEAPNDTLLSELSKVDVSPEASADLALLILADAVENIEAGVASILHLLLTTDGALEAEKDASLDAVVREGLRLQTPGQVIPRVTKSATTLLGHDLSAGSPVYLALGSANRDPAVFEDPDAFCPGRAAPMLTFGSGLHRCLGESLALAQIGSLVRALLDRGVKLADPAQPLEYHARFGHRWPVSLSSVAP